MLTVHELAGRIARWHEMHLLMFECCGAWITNSTDPAAKPMWAALAQQHRWHAELWAGRFPVVPEVDLNTATRQARSELVSIDTSLAATSTTIERVDAVRSLVLDELTEEYRLALRKIDPVLDAPTIRILNQVIADLQAQLELLANSVGSIPSGT
jgi:hypothetical protein